MMQMLVPLILINVLVLLALGVIRQENPLEVWLFCLLAVANGAVFLIAAILASDNALEALTALMTNILPFAAALLGFASLMALMAVSRRGKHG
jgi:hypothetical protein